jgi:hypothetical protein
MADDRGMRPSIRVVIVFVVVSAVAILVGASLDVPWSYWASRPFADPPPKVDVYEAVLRHLVDADDPRPIYVGVDLCVDLMRSEDQIACPDHLSPEEQRELRSRTRDLARLVFVARDGSLPDEESPSLFVSLGPIEERSDGLRVEVGSTCGELCGSGSVLRLVETSSGYTISTDESFGHWIA